jgi:hypothetical protein
MGGVPDAFHGMAQQTPLHRIVVNQKDVRAHRISPEFFGYVSTLIQML